METTIGQVEQDGATVTANGAMKPRRKRTGRKRTRFQIPPRPAPAVKDLWRSASEEQQRKAHTACVAILEYWLGKRSKQEVAKELAVPPLRVWQLSQIAVSGMLAGLLKQPRARRGRPPSFEGPPEDDPRILRKKIQVLETQLSRTEDLVRVLRMAPWASTNSAARAVMERPTARGRKADARRPKPSRRGRTSSNPAATPARRARRDRTDVPQESPLSRGAPGAG